MRYVPTTENETAIRETIRAKHKFHGTPRYDYIIVDSAEPAHPSDPDSSFVFAQVLCFFTISTRRLTIPLVYVQWYPRTDPWRDCTGMRIVRKGGLGIISPKCIMRSCHIVPRFHDKDKAGEYKTFYVNEFANIDSYLLL